MTASAELQARVRATRNFEWLEPPSYLTVLDDLFREIDEEVFVESGARRRRQRSYRGLKPDVLFLNSPAEPAAPRAASALGGVDASIGGTSENGRREQERRGEGVAALELAPPRPGDDDLSCQKYKFGTGAGPV